jgi:hypothetical protein
MGNHTKKSRTSQMGRQRQWGLRSLMFAVLVSSWFAFLVMTPRFAWGTVLSDLAAQMQPGEWRTFTPNNSSSISSGNWAVYGESATWDPTSRKLLFLGSYHPSPYTFAIYQDSNNTWNAGPQLPGLSFNTAFVGHGYDQNTVDPVHGYHYFLIDRARKVNLPSGTPDVFRYNIATNTWTSLPINALKTITTCCDVLIYFPEMGGLLWIDPSGPIYLFSDSTQQWSLLTKIAPFGGTWNFAEYNPVQKVVVFGSGNGNRPLFKISSTGQVTQLGNIPISLYDGSGFTGHFTTDPVSGDHLGLTPSFQFYRYNLMTDTWTLSANQPPSTMVGAIVATPISTYGVTVFASCGLFSSQCDGKLFVYKHSTSTVSPPSTPAPTVALSANPISVTSGSASTLSWSSTNATSCSASGGWSGTKGTSGSQTTGNLSTSTTFTLTCTGTGGSASQSATVTVASSTSPPPTSGGSPTLLVKFGKNSTLNTFGLSGWSNVIKDIYTDYRDFGPGGTTIVVGNNYAYNYQGVTGTARSFLSGEKIRVTWYNNSANTVTFTPNISFTSSGRISGSGWYPMTSVTVPLFGSASSEYTFTSATAGSYSVVNVNVNYSNTQVIVADKIELLPVGSSSSPSPSFDFSLSNGGNKSVSQGQSVSNSIAATLVSGTAQAISFSTAGLPSGATVSFLPNSCTPACSTNMSIATSASTSAGSYPITVTAVGGGVTKTSGFTLTVTTATATPPSQPPSTSADADFQARCSAPGVVKCQGMDTMGTFGNADLITRATDSVHGNIQERGDGQYRATVDTSIKKSGAGSLRFKLDAGYAAANIAGQYLCCGNTGTPPTIAEGLGAAMGPNTDWYVQFAVRFSPEYFSNQKTYWNSTPKIAIFHFGNQSCASKELTINQWGSTGFLAGYKDCGGQGFRTDLDGFTFRSVQQGTPYLFQQGDYACEYPGVGNCWQMPSNKWITIYLKIHNGTWGTNNSTIEGWYAIDGQPYKKWLNITANFTIGCNSGAPPCSSEVFNNFTLTPYMTGLSTSAAVDAFVWYDEVIVSRQPIAAPGNSQSLAPPDAPTGLTLK